MATADQVAANLSKLLESTQPRFAVTATQLQITLNGQTQAVYLPPQQGQPRGIQAR